MEEGESGNIIDYAMSDLEFLFKQDDKYVQALVDIINRKGANFSSFDIGQSLNYSDYGEFVDLKASLAWLVHNYAHHKEQFQNDLVMTKSNKTIVEKITKFLSKLETRGLDGLNVIFELQRSEFLDRTTIARLRNENMLKTITDENEKIIGHLPFIRITFEFIDEKGNAHHIPANLTITGLHSIIDGLMRSEEEAKEAMRLYKEKLGDMVIFEEEVK